MLKCYSYDIVCQEIPDEISLAVNISGCPNRCPGCHSPWLWEDEGELFDDRLLAALMERYGAAITCFCFMGGDAQPSEIERLARLVKTRYPDTMTAWYSGKETLPPDFDISVLDYLKLGPYIESLGGLKSSETNQALYRVGKDGTLTKILL